MLAEKGATGSVRHPPAASSRGQGCVAGQRRSGCAWQPLAREAAARLCARLKASRGTASRRANQAVQPIPSVKQQYQCSRT